jgi:hypothetical protein
MHAYLQLMKRGAREYDAYMHSFIRRFGQLGSRLGSSTGAFVRPVSSTVTIAALYRLH